MAIQVGRRLFKRVAQYHLADIVRGVAELENNISDAFDQLFSQSRYLTSAEYSISTSVASTSVTIRHGLSYTPNRFTVVYNSATYGLVPTTLDGTVATFTVTSTSGVSLIIALWRQP